MNQQDYEEPLFTAAQQGNLDVLRRLLDQALLQQVMLGRPGMLDALINSATCGTTPLWIAACNDHGPIVTLLLEKGAAVNHGDSHNRTALWAAGATGSVSAATALLHAKAAVDQTDDEATGPLCMAAQTGSVQIVHALLGAKAAVNQADRWDNTPLYAAARAGNIRAVQALLGAKATVNQAADDNMTALYTAAHAGRADIVRVLLLAKAATDQTDSRDRSPLYMAAQTKSIQTAQTDSIRAVQALLGAKAAVDQAADDGMTALSVAARRGCIETVRLLTDRKANIEPEADGTDYEAVAWVDPHQDVMQFPGDENEDSGSAEIRFANKPLWLAAMGGHASTVRLLLSKHADIECEDDRDSTALWAAAANQKTGVVSILVDAKASAGTANKGGVTPLQMAVMSGPGSKLTVKRLLAAKANPDASDDEDNTALSLCLEQTDNPSACLAIADLLVEHKAEVDPVSQTKISTLRAQAAPLAEGGEKKRTRLTTQYTGLR